MAISAQRDSFSSERLVRERSRTVAGMGRSSANASTIDRDHVGVEHDDVLRSDVGVIVKPVDDRRRLVICRIAVAQTIN